MPQKTLFSLLGAPLKNTRWSWGAVRADGTVFLRVWQDLVRRHDSANFVQVTHHDRFGPNDDEPGSRERLAHVELLRRGAPSYLIMCRAVDVSSKPREVEDFDEEEVIKGGRGIEMDGDWWLELGPHVPVVEVAKSLRIQG